MITGAPNGDERDGVDGPTLTTLDDRGARVLMLRGGRARLAETCGTRDEGPSSNLGRGNPSRLHGPTG